MVDTVVVGWLMRHGWSERWHVWSLDHAGLMVLASVGCLLVSMILHLLLSPPLVRRTWLGRAWLRWERERVGAEALALEQSVIGVRVPAIPGSSGSVYRTPSVPADAMLPPAPPGAPHPAWRARRHAQTRALLNRGR